MGNLRADMPKDVDGHSIQTLSPVESTVVQIVIAGGNQTGALPAGAAIVEVAASDICKIKFGTASVDATGSNTRIFPAGAAVYRVPPDATHLAVTQLGTSSGFVTVAELK